MTNIQKVAKRANVSVATVSRVINNIGNVSSETAARVQKAIEELNYAPNMLARKFRTSESRSILVLLTSISNLFYMEVVHGISDYANANGYDILLSETNGELSKQIDGMEKVKNRVVDGTVILETTIHDNILQSLQKNYPVVQCCSFNDELDMPYVIVDNFKGGYMAAKELLRVGRTKFAFIGTNDKSMYNRERRKGFLKALEEAGVNKADVFITNTALSFDGGKAVVADLMAQKVNAAFFVSDMQAVGAMKALLKDGVNIPGNISIIGYDDLEISSVVNPGLTSIGQPAREMGRETARLLITQIKANGENGSAGGRNIIFQPELISRESV